MTLKISPSVLAADFTQLGSDVQLAEQGGADVIHVDIMDGHFVPNIAMGPHIVEALKRITKLPLDVHLMIEEPQRYFDAFAQAGSDSLTIHVETCPHIHRNIQQIKALGLRAGVAINPGTSLATLEPLLEEVDIVLMMTVNPGFGGQSFIQSSLDRIKSVRERLTAEGLDADIGIDGGVTMDNAGQIATQGGNLLIAGSTVFANSMSIPDAVKMLRANARGQ